MAEQNGTEFASPLTMFAEPLEDDCPTVTYRNLIQTADNILKSATENENVFPCERCGHENSTQDIIELRKSEKTMYINVAKENSSLLEELSKTKSELIQTKKKLLKTQMEYEKLLKANLQLLSTNIQSHILMESLKCELAASNLAQSCFKEEVFDFNETLDNKIKDSKKRKTDSY